jgi:hypothetical protein
MSGGGALAVAVAMSPKLVQAVTLSSAGNPNAILWYKDFNMDQEFTNLQEAEAEAYKDSLIAYPPAINPFDDAGAVYATFINAVSDTYEEWVQGPIVGMTSSGIGYRVYATRRHY